MNYTVPLRRTNRELKEDKNIDSTLWDVQKAVMSTHRHNYSIIYSL